VPWRRVLRAALDSELRRGMADLCGSPKVHRTTGILRPSWAKPLPRVAVVADTSGSMTTAGGRVLGEIVGVVRQANAPVDICWCDVTPQWQYRVRSRHELRPRGGGGTDLRPAITAALEVRPKYDLIVVVTDGETPWPSTPIPQAYIVTIGTNVPDGWRGMRVEV
jgi:predicted metal-dependent peptidase